MKIMGFITSIIAWFLKNVNMIVGIVGAIGKLVAGIINVFQPANDKLVDAITAWTERIQKIL